MARSVRTRPWSLRARVAGNLDANSVALRSLEISIALHEVQDAMVGAGYTDDMWTVVVQDDPSPLPVRRAWNSDNVGGSSPHRQQESFHPKSWGELALRSCLRQACNNGSIRGGAFVIDQTGLKTATSPGCA